MKAKNEMSPASLVWCKITLEAADLRKRIQAAPPGPRPLFDFLQFAKAWSFECTIKEAAANGMPARPDLRDQKLCAKLYGRFTRWMLAAYEWQIYRLKKQCPGADHPDPEQARASFVGWIAQNKHTADDPRVIEFLKQAPTRRDIEYRRFQNPQHPDPWKHPALDTWLMLVWPLVEAQRWNYGTVLEVANKRFPEMEGKHPLGDSRDLSKYCKTFNEDYKLRVRARAGNPGEVTIPAAVENFAVTMPLLPL